MRRSPLPVVAVVTIVTGSFLKSLFLNFRFLKATHALPLPRQPPISLFPPKALFCPVGSNSRTRPADVPPGSVSPSHERRPLLHPPRGRRTAALSPPPSYFQPQVARVADGHITFHAQVERRQMRPSARSRKAELPAPSAQARRRRTKPFETLPARPRAASSPRLAVS